MESRGGRWHTSAQQSRPRVLIQRQSISAIVFPSDAPIATCQKVLREQADARAGGRRPHRRSQRQRPDCRENEKQRSSTVSFTACCTGIPGDDPRTSPVGSSARRCVGVRAFFRVNRADRRGDARARAHGRRGQRKAGAAARRGERAAERTATGLPRACASGDGEITSSRPGGGTQRHTPLVK